MRALYVSCLVVSLLTPALSMAIPPLDPFPLAGTVEDAFSFANAIPLLKPTGLKRSSYLTTIHSIVNFFRQYQQANGSIVDPYAHVEVQYSTPTYAHAASLLVSSGYNTSLLSSAASALTSSLAQLSNATCAMSHCNFFVFPSMMAFYKLKGLVDSGTVATWEYYLRNLDPAKTYINTGGNWGLVAVGGEYLRTTVSGFGDPTWWQTLLAAQYQGSLFTANGEYQDHSGSAGLNPTPYDYFPTKYLSVMLFQGYNASATFGPLSSTIEELMRRASWTHLLMQSPWGEIPTGGRSSQHQWNEAASTAIFELYASYHKSVGNMSAACMFQRAAHLSLSSVNRWLNPSGPLQIVKNHFPPIDRWGYEVYSFFTQYNLLPASQLATAYYFADPEDSIVECTTFADAGGFVIDLPDMKKIIANAGGTYIELETGADPHYDSTGLQRVHINTCGTQAMGECVAVHPLIGPTAGPPQEDGGMTVGVFWATDASVSGNTSITRLGNQTYLDVTAVTVTPGSGLNPSQVTFQVQYVLLGQGILVTEQYNLTSARVDVSSSVQLESSGHINRFGVTFPALLFDGVTNTTVTIPTSPPPAGQSSASVTASNTSGQVWGQQTLTVYGPSAGHSLQWSFDGTKQTVVRNGLASPIDCEISPIETNTPSIVYSIIGSGVAEQA